MLPVPPAAPHERQGPLEEELVEIGVPAALETINARRARKIHEPRGIVTVIGAEHLPRRVADHRVESGVGARVAVRIVKHLGELERPVKEAFACRHRTGILQQRA